MKAALSLTLILTLVMSALPVTAQQKVTSLEPAGPLGRAVTREAVRLAAAGESTSSSGEAVQQGGKLARSDWSRVRKLAPGTEIVVTVNGSSPAQRYFVAAEESDLTVLNVTEPTLPANVGDVLRDVASNHPEYLLAVRQRGMFVLPKDVRMVPDGVFVADRKVADLRQVVESIARTDIVEIASAVTTTGTRGSRIWSSVGRHARIGAGVGAVLGALLGIAAGSDSQCRDCIPTGASVAAGALVGAGMGLEIGAINGAVLGAFTGKTHNVIYHRP